jgi:hypothetical protein
LEERGATCIRPYGASTCPTACRGNTARSRSQSECAGGQFETGLVLTLTLPEPESSGKEPALRRVNSNDSPALHAHAGSVSSVHLSLTRCERRGEPATYGGTAVSSTGRLAFARDYGAGVTSICSRGDERATQPWLSPDRALPEAATAGPP